MSRQAARKRTAENRRRNKHGRTGAPRRKPGPPMRAGKVVETTTADATHFQYREGYRQGVIDGKEEARGGHVLFLSLLLAKRNAKDIKGLIEKYLGG